MPYSVVENHDGCESSKPWGVIKDDDQSLLGCHTSEAKAEAQIAAIQISEAERAITVEEPETGDYIRVSIRDEGDFQQDSFRTIDIDEEQGIKAVIGRPIGKDTTEVQTYLFDKEKWTAGEAKEWVVEHEERQVTVRAVNPIRKLFERIKAVFEEALEPEERAISSLRLYEQVWTELDRAYPDEWPWLTDFYVDDSGQLFAVFASDGKLHRVNFTIQDEQIVLGERTQVTETFTPIGTTRVFRQADGRHRWLSISATAVLNRCAEIDARVLFDGFVAHATETGEYPYRCFCHRGEQFRTGQADFLARDGNCYITSGLYDDTELARREIAALEKEPHYWGESIGYEPLAGPELVEVGGIEIPVYRSGIHTEISTLPEEMAAAWFTSTSIISEAQMERQMNDVEFGAFVKLFDGDEDKARGWLEENVDPANRQIEEREMITREVEPEAEPPAEPETESIQPVIELDDSALAAIVERMAESEVIASLNERIDSLMASVEALAKSAEGLQRSVTAQLKTAGEHKDRLEALERDEADKQDGWIKDLPVRVTMPGQRVTHRPSLAHSRRQADGGADYAAVAEGTLANMNTRTS